MKNALIVTILLMAAGCCSQKYRKIITDQEYQQMTEEGKAKYFHFFQFWQRIPVPGEHDYEEYIEDKRRFAGWEDIKGF